MHAVVQEEPCVVGIAHEIGGRRHVLAEQADAWTELGGAQDVPGDAVGSRIALHETDDARLAGASRSFGKSLRTGSVGCWRLLDEDRKATLQRGLAECGVLCWSDCHADGIQTGMLQQVHRIGVPGGNAIPVADQCKASRIDIAHRLKPSVQSHKLRQQHLGGMVAAADPANADHSRRAACSAPRRKSPLARKSASSS